MAAASAQCVVGPVERDAVVLAQVAQAVRTLPLGVEPARHPQRAQRMLEALADRVVERSAASRSLQEAAVELGVVGGEDRPVRAVAELGQHVVERRRALQRGAGDAVHVGRARPAGAASAS